MQGALNGDELDVNARGFGEDAEIAWIGGEDVVAVGGQADDRRRWLQVPAQPGAPA